MKNLILREKALSKNKSYCFQVYWSKPYYIPSLIDTDFKLFREDYFFNIKFSFLNIINFQCRWNRKVDHAGFLFELEILGLSTHFEIYDHRHWDYETDNWMVY